MRLAVSNIAWAPGDRDAAYAILRAHGVRGLEIAPALFLDHATDAFAPSAQDIADARRPMERAGLELVSMQSLLFGVSGAALFESQASRDRLETGMLRAIGLAERLAIPNLVFGSPKQRVIPPEMDQSKAEEIAIGTFRRLGDAAARAGTLLAIEANAAAYGTNFLNRICEAEAFVRKVDHDAIRLIIDVGALHMNGDLDQIGDIARRAIDVISHVHMSEPELAPAPARPAQAAHVISAMSKADYRGYFSIEMRTPENDPLRTLEQSVISLACAAAMAREAGRA